tara:strand:+ start:41064 stop:41330 length:267 start_codon:yes stop_codon:yes gene_type:complete
MNQVIENIAPTVKSDSVLTGHAEPSQALLDKLGLVPEEEMLALGAITKSTSEMWQRRRTGPPRIRIGNRYFYPLAGVMAFIDQKLEKQ